MIVTLALLCGHRLTAQDMSSCPMHSGNSQHQSDVEHHGDAVMGFPHDKTTHHFRIAPDGGAIEVTVNDRKEVDNLQAIRMHLKHIASLFSQGDFSVPIFIHGQTPPGVAEMKDRRGDITYTFEELPAGGRIRIATMNHDAVNAIHDFLKFQIQEHHTGDPSAE
jgi:hypothetical protein